MLLAAKVSGKWNRSRNWSTTLDMEVAKITLYTRSCVRVLDYFC